MVGSRGGDPHRGAEGACSPWFSREEGRQRMGETVPFDDGVGISVCPDVSGSRQGGGWGSEAGRRPGPQKAGRDPHRPEVGTSLQGQWRQGTRQDWGSDRPQSQTFVFPRSMRGWHLGPTTASMHPKSGTCCLLGESAGPSPGLRRAGARELGPGRLPQRQELRCPGPVADSRRRGASPRWHLWLGAFGPRHTSTACPECSAGA